MKASNVATSERHRILGAYARRQVDGRDGGAYFGLEDEAHLLRLEERRRVTLRLLHDAGLHDLSRRAVLDIGCGEGLDLLALVGFGASPDRLAGIDLRSAPIARAAERLPRADLRTGCGTELPWSDGSFDLVVLSTVFSSILDAPMRARLAEEAARVVTADGAVLCYDTVRDNPENPDVRRLAPDELEALFPAFERRGVRVDVPASCRPTPPRCAPPPRPIPAWPPCRLGAATSSPY